ILCTCICRHLCKPKHRKGILHLRFLTVKQKKQLITGLKIKPKPNQQIKIQTIPLAFRGKGIGGGLLKNLNNYGKFKI
ncbi:MAG: hypothetical protein SO050_08890, partial [Prevotella sp.]|nr:hypothetical protein [Prevotella sp.]